MLACLLAGCVRTLDGRKAMAVPFQKDTIESRYQLPLPQVWAAAKETLSVNGRLTGENTITKTLEAVVDEHKVWLKVEELDAKVTRVLVQSRGRAGGADINLASEVDKQIALRLATGAAVPPFLTVEPPKKPTQSKGSNESRDSSGRR